MSYLWIVLGLLGVVEIIVAVTVIRIFVLRLGARQFFLGVLYGSLLRSESRSPRLSFGARAQGGTDVRLPAGDTKLLIFVRPRCLASHRVARMVADQCASQPPGFSLVLVVVDDPVHAKRFAASLPACVEIVHARPSRIPKQVRSSLPCAVSLGEGGQVRHLGKVGGPSEIVRFAEASGDYDVRRWCKDAFTSWARARMRAVPAGGSTTSDLDVDSISSVGSSSNT
jgi:hypothetical protein